MFFPATAAVGVRSRTVKASRVLRSWMAMEWLCSGLSRVAFMDGNGVVMLGNMISCEKKDEADKGWHLEQAF